LDLNGGVHLVLRVKTDDAVRLDTLAAAERLPTELADAVVPLSDQDATAS
jgi:preprotein translocase subunit SecD